MHRGNQVRLSARTRTQNITSRPSSSRPYGNQTALSEFMSIDVGGMTPAASDEESDDGQDDYMGMGANLSNCTLD